MNVRATEVYGYRIIRPEIKPEIIPLLHACIAACDENTRAFRHWQADHATELKIKFFGSIALIIIIAWVW